ncbi:multidrug efflux MFS transporter [Xylophilus ampelinus]|uniref:Uncharacterized protein n=1 Tax=Xylophilus ampelinus TaxID=54067 RepID=A0A318SE96_9BURK|nr:hypothetical protein DFQ15_1292 [Xylophilus ampelinus]
MAATADTSYTALREQHRPRYRWLPLSGVVCTMASIMSLTIINMAIPGLRHCIAPGQERGQWVSSGFRVASACSQRQSRRNCEYASRPQPILFRRQSRRIDKRCANYWA